MIISYIDWIGDTNIGGWALDTLNPDHPARIEAYCEGQLAGTTQADEVRAELDFVREGRGGFVLPLSAHVIETYRRQLALGHRTLEIYCISGAERTKVALSEGFLNNVRVDDAYRHFREFEIVDDAIIRADGALFLHQGKNNHSSHIFGEKHIEQDAVDYWVALITLCSLLAERHQFRFLFSILASKESVEGYGENLTPSPNRPALAIMRAVERKFRGNVHYNCWTLTRNCLGESKFMKRDTHMNGLGVYLSYADLCKRLGLHEDVIVPREAVRMDVELVTGDLFGHILPKPDVVAKFPTKDVTFISNPIAKTYSGTMGSHETAHIDYRNSNIAPYSLLLFGLSSPHMMMSLLIESFSRVDYNHTYSLDFNKIESGEFDALTFVIPERYLTRIHRGLTPASEIFSRLEAARHS